MKNFLAVCVSITYHDFRKESRVIGMVELTNGSSAERIKDEVEKVVNDFDFDKKKITGVVCESASFLVRLFRQNDNNLFDVNIEQADIQEKGFAEEDVDEHIDQLIQDIRENQVTDIFFGRFLKQFHSPIFLSLKKIFVSTISLFQ
ncbi:hypothetical protein BpHYR1_052918 [Brachionus plicatilis]|uniref:Uncharacterized protein n=1 Tax=Brachionus plicatilis TaxID=10195 RepID=A0A3M7S982_BRAPC|nr:hypothetical protein BpHYR1_052918 [Brachionus plicatilis]